MKPLFSGRSGVAFGLPTFGLPTFFATMAIGLVAVWLLMSWIPGAFLGAVGTPVEHRLSWHWYVRASPSKVIHPQAVVKRFTRGNVTGVHRFISGYGAMALERAGEEDEIPSVVLDFGQNTVGILSIEFGGADGPGGSLPGLRLAFSETLQHLSDLSDFTRSYNALEGSPDKLTPGTDQIAVKSHPYTWTNQLGCDHDSQVCSDGLHGFRYVKIYLDALPADAPYTSCSGHVSIESVSLQLSAFHGTPDTFAGWFECSDSALTQWWFDGVYTNDLCIDVFRQNDTEPRLGFSESLDGRLVLHDAPKRDRDPYVGDLAVAALTTYMSRALGVSEAAKNVLADLADHQREDGFIPPASIFDYTLPLYDYPLWWVVCSYDYVMHTGDVSYLTKYYPNLVSVLDNFYPASTNTNTNLLEKLDDYGDYGFLPRSGPVTYYNALYVLALQRASYLAGYLCKWDDADRWAERAAVVSHALNKHNFDDSVGAFYDGTCEYGYCETHAQDGNSLAILASIANKTRAKSILRHRDSTCRAWGNSFYDNALLGQDYAERVYAFISYFEISARFETGRVDSALDQIRRTWGYMARHDPGVTFWEGTGEEYNADSFKSMAHGWATGVVPLMTRYILGVKPTSPGFRTWEFRPHPGDLSWARGVVPTPNGKGIKVNWHRIHRGCFKMEIEAEGTAGGVVAVPVESEDVRIIVNGAVAWDGRGKRELRARFEVRHSLASYVEFDVERERVVVEVGP